MIANHKGIFLLSFIIWNENDLPLSIHIDILNNNTSFVDQIHIWWQVMFFIHPLYQPVKGLQNPVGKITRLSQHQQCLDGIFLLMGNAP